MPDNTLQIHGHRGARGRRPENTLAAMEFAVDAGADAAEVDLNVCGDGTIVVYHDAVISPVMARHLQDDRDFAPVDLADADRQAIRRFDVGSLMPGSAYAARFPLQEYVGPQEIPTLEEFLDWIVERAPRDFIVNLELKSRGLPGNTGAETYVAHVLDAVSVRDLSARTYLQSFDWRLVCLAQERLPSLLTGLLTDQQDDGDPRIPLSGVASPWTDDRNLEDYGGSVPRMVHATGVNVWSANFQDLGRESVREAHDLGLLVYTWTVNERADMERMIDLGVDAITTDYPERLAELLRR